MAEQLAPQVIEFNDGTGSLAARVIIPRHPYVARRGELMSMTLRPFAPLTQNWASLPLGAGEPDCDYSWAITPKRTESQPARR